MLFVIIIISSDAYGLHTHFVGTGWRHPTQRVRKLRFYYCGNTYCW